MTVKASISLTDYQDAYARDLVAKGQYPSLSAVMQRGLDLLRHETETREVELQALRTLIDTRSSGPVVSLDDGFATVDSMIAERRAARDLQG